MLKMWLKNVPKEILQHVKYTKLSIKGVAVLYHLYMQYVIRIIVCISQLN